MKRLPAVVETGYCEGARVVGAIPPPAATWRSLSSGERASVSVSSWGRERGEEVRSWWLLRFAEGEEESLALVLTLDRAVLRGVSARRMGRRVWGWRRCILVVVRSC